MKFYLAFYLGEQEMITMETFGWSESKYMAKLFLEAFEYIDRDMYTPVLLDVETRNIDGVRKYIEEYCGKDFAKNLEDTRIRTFSSKDKSCSVISTKYILYMWELSVQEEPDIISKDGDIFREKTSYNLLWMMSDERFIRNEQISNTLKLAIETIYRRYTTYNLLSKERIDLIKYWSSNGYLKRF